MSSERQIWVVPFFGQGHLFPCMELCKHIAYRKFKTTLIISSNLSSSIPSSLLDHPFIGVAQIPAPPPTPPELNSKHPHNHHSELAQGIASLLEIAVVPACAILDIMMDWTTDVFKKHKISTVAFFTSGACSAALEYAMWKARVVEIKPGETLLLPGLPKEMALTDSNLKHGPPPGPPPGIGGIGFPRPPPPAPAAAHGFSHGIKPGETLLLPGLPKEMALTDSDLKHGPPPGPPPRIGGIGFHVQHHQHWRQRIDLQLDLDHRKWDHPNQVDNHPGWKLPRTRLH